MPAIDTFRVEWREDGTATVLARLTARDGTGATTGEPGEGNWIKQADLSAITCSVFDVSSATPDTAITTPTVTISSAVQDTPVTSNALWVADSTGYNFLHDLAGTNFPTGGHVYRVEYKITTTGSAVLWGVLEGIAHPVRSS